MGAKSLMRPKEVMEDKEMTRIVHHWPPNLIALMIGNGYANFNSSLLFICYMDIDFYFIFSIEYGEGEIFVYIDYGY